MSAPEGEYEEIVSSDEEHDSLSEEETSEEDFQRVLSTSRAQHEAVLLRNQPEWLRRIYKRLIKNEIYVVRIYDKHLDLRGALLLAAGLARNTSLLVLELSNTSEFQVSSRSFHELGSLSCIDRELKVIVRGITDNMKLERLLISHNHVGVEGAKALAPLLERNATLWSLDLSNCHITGPALNIISQAIQRNPFGKMRGVKLYLNEIGYEGIEALASMAQMRRDGQPGLRRIMLARAGIDDFQAAILFLELEQPTSCVTTLMLHYNMLARNAMDQFAHLISINTTLRDVRLVGNNIGNGGAKAIARGLKSCRGLENLDLEQTGIGRTGAMALASSLAHNESLKHLNMDLNKITQEGARSFCDVLKQQNKTLLKLTLDDEYREQETLCRYYCELNRHGRREICRGFDTLPVALWPRVLERVCSHQDPNVRFGLLQLQPEVFRQPPRRQSNRKRKRRITMDL